MNIVIWGKGRPLSGLLFLTGLSLVFCTACAHLSNKAKEEKSQSTEVIKLEIVSTSWREKKAYDVQQVVKESLERVGFRIASAEDESYDAVLKIDYQEIKGSRCYLENRPYIPGDETIIDFTVQLEHKTLGQIFNRKVTVSPDPRIVTTQKLISPTECEEVVYENVLNKFREIPTFNYLGELIALRRGFFIDKLEDKDTAMRCWVAQLLGEIRYVRAVKPLIAALQDEEPSVRKEVAVALGKIGDARAIKPLQTIVATETDKAAKSSFEQALKKLQQLHPTTFPTQ